MTATWAMCLPTVDCAIARALRFIHRDDTEAEGYTEYHVVNVHE